MGLRVYRAGSQNVGAGVLSAWGAPEASAVTRAEPQMRLKQDEALHTLISVSSSPF